MMAMGDATARKARVVTTSLHALASSGQGFGCFPSGSTDFCPKLPQLGLHSIYVDLKIYFIYKRANNSSLILPNASN